MMCVDGTSLLVTVAALMVGNLASVNNFVVVTANDDQDNQNLNRQ